ncbi:MAG: flavodoxin family protein [Candidatus Bathyarchaeia archaeon]
MKLLGLSCGTKMGIRHMGMWGGNTEVLVKEALMEAEKLGVEVEFIRLLDLDIRPCIFCEKCLWVEKGPDFCPVKDDSAFLYDRIMECDGLILGAPVYSMCPPGYLKMFEERVLGPKVNVALLLDAKKRGSVDLRGKPRYIDGRLFKKRVGGLISVGGATTLNWLAFDHALLYVAIFSLNVHIVDKMRVFGTSRDGHVVLNEKWLERVRILGRNVAEAMKKPLEEVKWMGEPGVCPVCHCDFVTITGKGNIVECPVCGIAGTLTLENGKIAVTFPKEQQEHSRLTLLGLWDHEVEITENLKVLMQRSDLDQVPKKLEKYVGYGESLAYKLWQKRKSSKVT